MDAQTLRVVRRYRVGSPRGDAAISADGGTLAVEDPGGSLRLLDLHSGRVRTLAGAAAGVSIGALSPDGRTLATWDESGNVILWDVRKGLATESFEGHEGDAEIQVFSPDGRTLYTAGEDSRVIVWDVAGDRRLGVPFRTGFVRETSESFPPPFAISPDGRTLAVARLDGRVDLIDAETLRRTGGFEAFDGRPVLAIEYAPDGGTLAVAGVGGGVGIWDAASETRLGALLRAPRGPVEATRWPFFTEQALANPHNVQALAFGQGDLLAAAEVGGTVRIWDVGRRELAGPPLRLPPAVLGLAFSPDGSRLAIPFGAILSEDDGIEVRDVEAAERLARLPVDGEIRTVAFSPDGSLLAGGQGEPHTGVAGGVDGTSLLWATDGWRRIGAPLALRNASALAVAFSPDGRTLATSHDDGTVVLWDVASQRPIGSPLPGPTDLRGDPTGAPGSAGPASMTARFTPDGSRLFALHENGQAFGWEVDPNAWRQHACSIVGGGLAPEQWEEIVPEQDYIETCPSG